MFGSLPALLMDLFPDTVTYYLEVPDAFGKDTTVTPVPISIRAQCSGKTRQVKMSDGQIVSSSVQVIVAGTPGLTTNHKITLPARFSPRSPKILSVDKYTDEAGASHETVYFQ